MKKGQLRKVPEIPLEEGDEGIPGSLSSLIRYGVERAFEAFRADIRTHPGGLEQLAREFGVAEQTVRAWWNPNHGRSLTVSNLIEFLAVNPATNLRNTLNVVADQMAEYRRSEAERRLNEMRSRLEKVCDGRQGG